MQRVGNLEPVGSTRVRSDRILPATRWIWAIIVPFLVAAFIILYLFADHTQAWFAWGIQPPMSAMMLGAAYSGGAYFFVRAATNARWHSVQVGFLPVTTFATLMGMATILHGDRFNHGSVSFFAWVGLSFTTPFIVFLLWLRNRATDPGSIPHELRVPGLVRLVIGIVGALTLLTSIILFLQPGFMISVWPWQLTPLTARVMGALFALTGVGELAIALDARLECRAYSPAEPDDRECAHRTGHRLLMEELPSSESTDLGVHREHPLPARCKPLVLSLDGEARHSDQASRVMAARDAGRYERVASTKNCLLYEQ